MADYDLDGSVVNSVLDPILSFLSSVLPPPVYTLVESLISHSLTLIAALLKFVLTIFHVDSWDAQQVLPPLITLLAAYLALVSFYRTTGWMIRTAFFFVKWGGILSILAAGAGYFFANANANGGNGVGAGFNGGLVSMLGSALLGMFNENGQDPPAGSRGPGSSRRSRIRVGATGPRTRAQKAKERPKAWDSWDKHRDWQYKADAAGGDNTARVNEGVQEAVQKIVGVVQEAMGTGWWETVKSAVEGSGLVGSPNEERRDGTRSQRRSKQDTKAQGRTR
ncbi:hypothetical protein BD413DRAFT_96110 [Trametes elegans]|nr:hypothetical protein BD413DRAFT_96110 [Trametes elegans]